MWAWFAICYGIFVVLMAGSAGVVAIFYRDEKQRAEALKVLKFMWGTGTWMGGVVAVVVRLHEIGLL